MKISLKIIFLIIVSGYSLAAQTIYPCKAITEKGEPIDYQLSWNISPKGEYINILLNNDENPFGEEFIYILIDKKSGDSYIPYDSKAYHVDPETTWLVHNYKLTEPGEYSIYFVNSTQKRLAEQKIKVSYKDYKSYSSKDISDVYYDNCQMIFCQRVIAGKPLKELNDVTLYKGEAVFYVYLNNYKSLNTKKISINVWRKDSESFEYNEFVVAKKFKVDPLWNDTFFKFDLYESGEYKISVYNEREALIKFNFIRVHER